MNINMRYSNRNAVRNNADNTGNNSADSHLNANNIRKENIAMNTINNIRDIRIGSLMRHAAFLFACAGLLTLSYQAARTDVVSSNPGSSPASGASSSTQAPASSAGNGVASNASAPSSVVIVNWMGPQRAVGVAVGVPTVHVQVRNTTHTIIHNLSLTGAFQTNTTPSYPVSISAPAFSLAGYETRWITLYGPHVLVSTSPKASYEFTTLTGSVSLNGAVEIPHMSFIARLWPAGHPIAR